MYQLQLPKDPLQKPYLFLIFLLDQHHLIPQIINSFHHPQPLHLCVRTWLPLSKMLSALLTHFNFAHPSSFVCSILLTTVVGILLIWYHNYFSSLFPLKFCLLFRKYRVIYFLVNILLYRLWVLAQIWKREEVQHKDHWYLERMRLPDV